MVSRDLSRALGALVSFPQLFVLTEPFELTGNVSSFPSRPLPIYASGYIFSKEFFSAWIVISIIWVWGTMLVAGFFPIIDGREQIMQVWRGLRGGLKGEQTSLTVHTSTGTTTPVESGNASSEEKSFK